MNGKQKKLLLVVIVLVSFVSLLALSRISNLNAVATTPKMAVGLGDRLESAIKAELFTLLVRILAISIPSALLYKYFEEPKKI